MDYNATFAGPPRGINHTRHLTNREWRDVQKELARYNREMILVVSDALEIAEPILPGKFASLDVLERKHIQEWVRANPGILGEDLLVVSMEFDCFEGSKDRLDLLALDRDGNLVVIELKRDEAAGHADLQAIRYAAMMSSMTLDSLAEHYASYLARYCQCEITTDEARSKLIDYIGGEKELSVRPRIILCAEGFSQEIKQTAVWLNEAEIRIKCVTITPYKVNSKIVIVPDVIIPLVAADEYTIAIRQKRQEREKSILSNRLNVQTLIDAGLLTVGETIYLEGGPSRWCPVPRRRPDIPGSDHRQERKKRRGALE